MDKVYTTDELAAHLRVPVESLAQWRRKKKGPAYFRPGKRVLYREDAVNAWQQEQEDAETARRESA